MRRLSLPTLLIAMLAATAVSAGAASPASAASNMVTGIADDDVTLRKPELIPEIVPQFRQKGMDVVRITLVWSRVAPEPLATRQPDNFDPTDPNSPRYDWDRIDRTVNAVVANGMRPMIVLTAPMPNWGSQVPSRRDSRYKPDPDKFAAFATAVARRYGDRVDDYIVYNEPNLFVWLMPQWTCTGRRCTLVGPQLYREVLRKTGPAIKAADPGAKILGGALAPGGGQKPNGSAQQRVAPLAWMRGMGCVTSKYKRDRRSAPCKKFSPASMDGFAYHPHSGVNPVDQPRPQADAASLADLGKLTKALDRIQRAGGVLNGKSRTKKLDLYLDEYGIQTNPPDPVQGVSLKRQDLGMQQASYMAWKAPRVRLMVFYLWRDEPVDRESAGAGSWQSGIFFENGRPKPAAAHFANPFWVDLPKGRTSATIWGQIRPNPGASARVQRKSGRRYTTIRTVRTNRLGFFSFKRTVRSKTSFRFQYTGTDGRTKTSATMTVAPKRR